jgi:hypothetical protein
MYPEYFSRQNHWLHVWEKRNIIQRLLVASLWRSGA